MALASTWREGIEIPWKRSAAATRPTQGRGDAGPGKRPAILTHARRERNLVARRCRHACHGLLLGVCLAATGPLAAAEPLQWLVQPPAWRGEPRAFDPRPLGALLARAVGVPVRVRISDDTLSHWHAVRAPDGYQLAFDEAHFTAYRVRHHGFRVLARAAGDVRFAVIASPGTLIATPGDLVARRVAVAAPPALAPLRLLELFPDAVRVPLLQAMVSRDAALAALAAGQVAGAVLVLDDAASAHAGRVALITDASPGRGFSVAPGVSEAVRTALLRALTGAHGSPEGRRALARLAVQSMESASAAGYEDSERLLRGTWGYRAR